MRHSDDGLRQKEAFIIYRPTLLSPMISGMRHWLIAAASASLYFALIDIYIRYAMPPKWPPDEYAANFAMQEWDYSAGYRFIYLVSRWSFYCHAFFHNTIIYMVDISKGMRLLFLPHFTPHYAKAFIKAWWSNTITVIVNHWPLSTFYFIFSLAWPQRPRAPRYYFACYRHCALLSRLGALRWRFGLLPFWHTEWSLLFCSTWCDASDWRMAIIAGP